MALCVGFVLSTSVIGDLKNLLSQTSLSVTSDTLGVILLVAPLIVTLLMCRKAHQKGLGLFMQLVAALCAGGLLALSVGPLLATNTQLDPTSSGAWTNLAKIQASIIGVGSVVSLLIVWSGGFKHAKKH